MLQLALVLVLAFISSGCTSGGSQQTRAAAPVRVSPATVTQQGSSLSVSVAGEVNTPGTFPWREGLTLSGALQAAGGVKEWPSRSKQLRLIVTHASGGRSIIKFAKWLQDPQQYDVALQSGDKIDVSIPKPIY